ncbi:unnamed protein product [Symbiodinium sp. CCMP2456]|nr:unnamed protein product [Symbiodinium sp. CCMP2456]
MAKLAKASERLVSCSAADILKQDFEALFATALTGNDIHSLSQMKTWMASTFADRAHRAQAEAIVDQQIAEFISRLEVQLQDPNDPTAPVSSLSETIPAGTKLTRRICMGSCSQQLPWVCILRSMGRMAHELPNQEGNAGRRSGMHEEVKSNQSMLYQRT